MVPTDQIAQVAAVIRETCGEALLALYLHGSAAGSGLRPQSDLDILAIVDRPITVAQRQALLAALLPLSGRHPAPPGGPRPVEVMLFRQDALAADDRPQAEFVYGEWLRDGFEAGTVPAPVADPDHLLVLAQARQSAIPLFGPDPGAVLPAPSPRQVRRAMREALPGLLAGLRGDERNVLLTLARMWHTAETGGFAGKDEAAAWAMARLGAADAAPLDEARRGYLGAVRDDWRGREASARRLAETLRMHVATALSADRDGRTAR